MQHNENFSMAFLKQKIGEIKTALFKTEEIDLESQLPNNIINTLKVGDDGIVSFLTVFKGYHGLTAMIGKPFFACLDYYRKEDNCHLRLCGKATIEQDPEELLITNYSTNNYGIVLVNMKILHAEFYEKKIITNLPWPEKIKSAINHLFIHNPRVYNFS